MMPGVGDDCVDIDWLSILGGSDVATADAASHSDDAFDIFRLRSLPPLSPLPKTEAEPEAVETASLSSSASSSPTPAVSSSVSTAVDDRRVRHRQIDAKRRSREAAAFDRLRQSLRAANGADKSVLDRTRTLMSAAETIDKLLAMTERNSHAETTMKRSRADDEEAAHASSSTQNGTLLSRSLRADAFFAEVLSNSTIRQIIFDVDSGACLFINRLPRSSDIRTLESRCLIPRHEFLAMESPQHLSRPRDRTFITPDGHVLNKFTLDQPPASMELVKQLYRNERSSIDAIMLIYDIRGRIIPLTMRAWLSTVPGIYAAAYDKNDEVTLLHLVVDDSQATGLTPPVLRSHQDRHSAEQQSCNQRNSR